MNNPRVESDSYDRGIAPAETAARKQREGENYKRTQDDADPATEAYTVDQEGLVNNYAIEPEMYYEKPGDLTEEAEAAERAAELSEINDNDEAGKLTIDHDDRGKGPGLI